MYIKITNWISLPIIPYDACHKKTQEHVADDKKILKYYTGHGSRVREVENNIPEFFFKLHY